MLPLTSENLEQKFTQLRELRKEFEAQPKASSLSQQNLKQLLQNLEKMSAKISDSIGLQAERQQSQSESVYSFYNPLTLADIQSKGAPKNILVLIRLRKEDLDKIPTKRDWVIPDTLSEATADLRKMTGQILPESCKCSEWAGIILKVEKVELLKPTAGEIAKELAGIWVIRVAICD